MKIDTIKDLEAVLKLCRKQGVTSISIDGIQLAIGDMPEEKPKTEQQNPAAPMPEYTQEQMLLWSVPDFGA